VDALFASTQLGAGPALSERPRIWTHISFSFNSFERYMPPITLGFGL
jgi:hypothetical protein